MTRLRETPPLPVLRHLEKETESWARGPGRVPEGPAHEFRSEAPALSTSSSDPCPHDERGQRRAAGPRPPREVSQEPAGQGRLPPPPSGWTSEGQPSHGERVAPAFLPPTPAPEARRRGTIHHSSARIELVSGVTPGKGGHVLLCRWGTLITDDEVPVRPGDSAHKSFTSRVLVPFASVKESPLGPCGSRAYLDRASKSSLGKGQGREPSFLLQMDP